MIETTVNTSEKKQFINEKYRRKQLMWILLFLMIEKVTNKHCCAKSTIGLQICVTIEITKYNRTMYLKRNK